MVKHQLLWVGLLCTANLLFAAGESPTDLAAREIIVKWLSLPLSLDAADLLPGQAERVESIKPALPVQDRYSSLAKASVLRARSVPDAAVLLAELNADPRVEYAEFRPIRELDALTQGQRPVRDPLDAVPNDPFYTQQWGLQAVDAEAAWTEVLGDSTVTIAVVDLGVWFGHPELEGISWRNPLELSGVDGVDDDHNGYVDDYYGYDFVDGDGDPTPTPLSAEETHGTHVAGIAAAHRNNGRGIAGIAAGCTIMGIRAGQGNSITYGYEGIYYACRAGAKVINCSWGGSSDSQYEQEVIQYAIDQGCILVVSAGNGNTTLPHYPAAIEGVLSVAATGVGDVSANFSHHGPWVKVSAPGINILSTIFDSLGAPIYASWQGTSMSAPLVAGICALVQVRYPSMSGREIASRVIASSEPIDHVNPNRAGLLGLGRVNAWRAVADDLIGVHYDEIVVAETGGNGDGRVSPGESASLSISVVNDLADAYGVIGAISTTLDSIRVDAPLAFYGDLPADGVYFSGAPFQISLGAGMTRPRSIPLTVDWTRGDGRLLGRSTFNAVVDTSWVSVDNGNLRLGFAEDGSLGYHDYVNNVTLGPGLRVSDGSTHALYHGCFLLGADGKVADNAYGSHDEKRFDWRVLPGSFAEVVPSTRADIETRAVFDDRGSDPFSLLFAHVEAAALGWTDDEARDFLILEYTVTNESVNPWSESYLGCFMDWDLVSSGANIGGFDTQGNLAYAAQTLPAHPMIGVASINLPLSRVQTLDNRAEFIDVTTWGDERKWEIITSEPQDNDPEPKDISQIIVAGPLAIDAHSTVTAAFAVVTGASIEELRIAADAAHARYDGPVVDNNPPSERIAHKATLLPNPATGADRLKLVLPMDGFARVRLYNVLGQLVADFNDVRGGPSGAFLDLSHLGTASGLLLYSIEANGKQTFGKLIRLR